MTRMSSVIATCKWLNPMRDRATFAMAALFVAIALATASGTAQAGDDASAASADASIAANPTLNPAPSSNFASQKVDGQPFFLLYQSNRPIVFRGAVFRQRASYYFQSFRD